MGGGKGRFSAPVYVFIALSLFSFFVLLFSTRSFILDFKDMGLSVFSIARIGVHEVSSFFSRTVLSVSELSRLRKEHKDLLDRVARYERMERNAVETAEENRRLREQLSLSHTLPYRVNIPAEVIGRDPTNLFSSLVINKGRHSGITNNMAVVAFQNGSRSLVGKVIQTSIMQSHVMPLYDENFYVSARMSASRYEGIVEGKGNPASPLVMRFIPKQARDEISLGDMVVSSGLGGLYPKYPREINIGRVSKINYHENEIAMEVELEPEIDFSRLEYVFVIDDADAVEDLGSGNGEAYDG